jgi:ankyrin repeat protein
MPAGLLTDKQQLTLLGSAAAAAGRFLLDEHSTRINFSIGEKDGYTPMHGAGFQGRADIARLLIAAGLDPSDRHKVSATQPPSGFNST